MSRSVSGSPLFALGLLLAVTTGANAAAPSASGTCKYKDSKIEIRDGYVFQEPDPFDATKKRTVIAISSAPLDRAKLAAAKDVARELTSQAFSGDGSQVKLTLGEGGVTSLNAYLPPGTSLSRSGTSFGELKLARNDAKGLTGTFQVVAKEANEISCTVSFDLDFVAPKPALPSKPLAAGGGAPGKAYLSYVAAMKAGDVDALAKLMPKARAQMMLAHRKDPEFEKQLGFLRSMAPAAMAVTGGSETAEGAELQVEGKDADANRVDGTVTMILDGGAWRLEKEDLTTHTK